MYFPSNSCGWRKSTSQQMVAGSSHICPTEQSQFLVSFLGVDSPFFSTIVLSTADRCFPRVLGGLERFRCLERMEMEGTKVPLDLSFFPTWDLPTGSAICLSNDAFPQPQLSTQFLDSFRLRDADAPSRGPFESASRCFNATSSRSHSLALGQAPVEWVRGCWVAAKCRFGAGTWYPITLVHFAKGC